LGAVVPQRNPDAISPPTGARVMGSFAPLDVA
jgi:hypothetical protein